MADGMDVLEYLDQQGRAAREQLSDLRKSLSNIAVAMNEYSSGGGIRFALTATGIDGLPQAKRRARLLDSDMGRAREHLADLESALDAVRSDTRRLVDLARESSVNAR